MSETLRRRPPARTGPPGNVVDDLVSGLGLFAGAANVIMQLSRAPVAYGVMESRVESGELFRHPLKRTRTTLSYIAVAALGTETDKAVYRKAVNRAHAQVHSTPQSPVEYNAFDRQLQLWVAACIYKGLEDLYELYFGPPTGEAREALYEAGTSMGTTLQARRDVWPADRDGFEAYWTESLTQIHIDDRTRAYLRDVASLRQFGPVVHRLFGRFNLFVTTGFLPQPFRDEMGFAWSADDQARFDRFTGRLAALNRRLPRTLRRFPFNYLLWDVRRRVRTGRTLV